MDERTVERIMAIARHHKPGGKDFVCVKWWFKQWFLSYHKRMDLAEKAGSKWCDGGPNRTALAVYLKEAKGG